MRKSHNAKSSLCQGVLSCILEILLRMLMEQGWPFSRAVLGASKLEVPVTLNPASHTPHLVLLALASKGNISMAKGDLRAGKV